MNALILGKGFLGQSLYRHLKAHSNELTQSGATGEVRILSQKDITYTDVNILTMFLKNEDFDIVINASGYTGIPNIDAAEDDKKHCWRMNVEVPSNIMAAIDASNGTGGTYAKLFHISSGCIFNGYEAQWKEDDIPNFGLFNPNSSFYSKTKHAAETILKDRNAVLLRIRMPFTGNVSHRNYFAKILKYDNLISTPNSVTCVEDFCESVLSLVRRRVHGGDIWGVYHLVNQGTLTAKKVVEVLWKYGLSNPNHKFIELHELDTKAARSNCILSTEQTEKKLLHLPPAELSLERCVKKYAQNINKIDYNI